MNETNFGNPTTLNELLENDIIESNCIGVGFKNVVHLIFKTLILSIVKSALNTKMNRNDCNTMTLTTEEDKKCTVKNYMHYDEYYL